MGRGSYEAGKLKTWGTFPGRDVKKRYFTLPNEIFTLGLDQGEIAVYAYLLFCEDRKTYQCWPSFKRIGQCTGMSPTRCGSTCTGWRRRDSSTQKRPPSREETAEYKTVCSCTRSAHPRGRGVQIGAGRAGRAVPPKIEVIALNSAQDRPGSLFVCENTVEHMSWGPPLAAQNLRRINKEKGFSPDDF